MRLPHALLAAALSLSAFPVPSAAVPFAMPGIVQKANGLAPNPALFGRRSACPRGLSEHRIDWMAFTGADKDPAGVPRRVEGRVSGRALGGDTIALHYGGLTRRLDFDSPRALPAQNLTNGFFRTDYDLLQFEEYVETDMVLPRPLSNFTLVFGDIGTSERADGGVRDAVWVEATTPDGRRITPSYFYPTMSPRESAAHIKLRAQREGFGAPWMLGEPRHARIGGAANQPIGAAFAEPVVSITIRYSGLPLEHGGGWAHGLSANPPAQTVDILSGAYCG